MKKEVFIRLIFLFLIGVMLFGVFSSNVSAPCGDGKCKGQEDCNSCPEDCGACPPPPSPPPSPPPDSSAETSTSTSSGESEPPVNVIPKSPANGDTIKRGTLLVLAEGFQGDIVNPYMDVTAESEIFGNIKLENNFEYIAQGTYGARVKIGRNITKGQYAIIIKAVSGRRFDQQRILINVDPEIYIKTSVDETYFKGGRIKFDGDLSYFSKDRVNKTKVNISINAEDFSLTKILMPGPDGKFKDSYLISFAEPDGVWNITETALDEDENEGSAKLSTTVYTPQGFAYYTVTFLSPLKDAEYKRGGTVPISVEVREEGNPVENATVDFRNPKAEIITLKEVIPGTYAAEYKLNPDDFIGRWHIPVQAVKSQRGTIKAGGNKVTVNIRPAALNLDLITPTTTKFFAGLKEEIKAELKYPDGTRVENADITATIGNEKIQLTESKPGVYSAPYLFTEKNAGISTLELSASDIYGNSITTPPKAINVEKIGKYELKLRLFYYNVLLRYWYLGVLGIIFIVIVISPFWHRAHLKAGIKKTTDEEKRVLDMQKDLQLKYFKHHSISRGDYDKLMLNYRERSSDLKERKLKLEKSLKWSKKE